MASGASAAALDPKYTPEIVLSGERVGGWERISNILRGAGLLWKASYPPEQVGVHPSNRSSFGVGGAESRTHGAQILQAGLPLWKRRGAACKRPRSSTKTSWRSAGG